ncbi:helix-turn-helix domain-containing protein [Paraburkholderia sp. SEWSISQ10-3 4]|jgi:transcriptional regulator with XRE-family HTH domain|uniref:helix-turn-helix domain-containing protein n=1 Tax=Paraburkholderia TaxID=1822464 RepID=UPI002250A385|nr:MULTISPECIES: helix-turn-helix transcriptional regulator [Paraburkholderia]MCX4142272.1 helix-turn-helix transcriptional regulator [Paraburkholderia aspalathi]MDN7174952.1 helix-turn-helix domain-containing protein [Paraburkholderia sp. SEWSISQ10-3 4]MDQ6504593.1 helix-turn-helix domain-containing protein [Paraburkholderia aspalathi]
MTGLSPLNLAMNPKDEQFFKALGVRIACARKAHELTQQQLAGQLGIAQQTLAHYEGGRLRLPASLLPELTRTLGLSSDELLGQNVTPDGKRGPSSKLQQQIEAISRLPKARQRFVSEMLDTVLAQSQQ